MNGQLLRTARKRQGWTQAQAAVRLGVSQPYLALLESGKRKLGPRLARRATRTLSAPPTLVPPSAEHGQKVSDETLARRLAALGYPGFASMRAGWKTNPAEVLVTALSQNDLDSRVTEALPWVLLRYPDLDMQWLVSHAKVADVTNRLGFVVDLSRQVAEAQGGTQSPSYRKLTELSNQLRKSKLEAESTLAQESLSQEERNWLRANRPDLARFWNVLTDLSPNHLQFV